MPVINTDNKIYGGRFDIYTQSTMKTYWREVERMQKLFERELSNQFLKQFIDIDSGYPKKQTLKQLLKE